MPNLWNDDVSSYWHQTQHPATCRSHLWQRPCITKRHGFLNDFSWWCLRSRFWDRFPGQKNGPRDGSSNCCWARSAVPFLGPVSGPIFGTTLQSHFWVGGVSGPGIGSIFGFEDNEIPTRIISREPDRDHARVTEIHTRPELCKKGA